MKAGGFIIAIISLFLIYFAFPGWVFSQETGNEQGEDKEKDIIEELETYSLKELLNVEVTTASKRPEKVGEIPASVVLITREQIEKFGYQTLTEILENIPGLYYTDDYTSKNFGIRGFWTAEALKNIVVLVNDIQQTEFLGNSNLLELFPIPAEAIDRIEVVRGPMSVMYGNGAFFGAINIFTNRPAEKGKKSFVSSSMGSEKTGKVFFRAAGKGDDFNYSFNSSYSSTDGINKPLSKMGNSPGTTMTTKGFLENSEKYFNFSGTYKNFLFDSSYSESHKGILSLIPPAEDGTLTVWKAFRLNFGYRKELSKKTRFNAKFLYFMNQWTFDYDFFVVDNFYGRQINGSTGYRAELNFFYNPIPRLQLTLGFNYNHVPEITSDYTVPAFGLNLIHNHLAKGESMNTESLFTQADYKLSKKFKVVAGFRLDHVPQYTFEKQIGDFNTGQYSFKQDSYLYDKVVFIPRLALIYSPDKKNFLKFLYGKAISRPSFFQNLDPINNPDIIIPQLTPETIQTLEMNYTGNISKELSVSLSLFYNILDKLIFRTLLVVNDTVVSYHANVGEMATSGLELTLHYSPVKEFQLEFSGTYQDTNDQREGFKDIEPGYSPKFLGYMKASYSFNKNVSLALTGNWVDKMEAYWDTTLKNDNGTYGRRIGDPVDGYFLLGANLRVNRLFGTNLFLNFRGSNLLDQEVRYPADSNNSLLAPRGTIGRGISFLFTLGWKF